MKFEVKVRKIFDQAGPLKAVTSVTLDDMYVVHGVKVIDGPDGLFMSMPDEKFTNKEGQPDHRDIFHPITSEARAVMQQAVLAAYEAAIHNPNNH